MSLINKDFRTHNTASIIHRNTKLRWSLFAITCIIIAIAIVSKFWPPVKTEIKMPPLSFTHSTKDKNTAGVDTAHPVMQGMVREKFSLSLPKLQPKKKKSIKQGVSNQANNTPLDQWRKFKVKSGDSLARLFKRAGISAKQVDELMRSDDAVKILRRIYPDNMLRIQADADGTLQALRYDINKKSSLIVERKNGHLIAKIAHHQIDVRTTHASGKIKSSLYLAAKRAGISQNIIMKMASIFGWDIDFAQDIRAGDQFTVLYEELYHNDEKIADGNILAAEFINQGKTYRAVRYTNPQTNISEYYTPGGKSMRKTFLRTPVKFTRISSRFSLNRYHPILHRFRSHKGVDYAAKRGTPVYAAGDGKVIFEGRKGGYGRVIILQHGPKYTTLYAHLNSFNRKIRPGSRVKQGQTIAYVGSSGLATGPHLHYEFRVNGTHRNPLTVKLPKSKPIQKRYLANFELMTTPILAQLNSISRNQQLALADTRSDKD